MSGSCQLHCSRRWRKRIIKTDAPLTGPDGRATGSDQNDERLAGRHGAGRGGAMDKSEEAGDVRQQLCTRQYYRVAGTRQQKPIIMFFLCVKSMI